MINSGPSIRVGLGVLFILSTYICCAFALIPSGLSSTIPPNVSSSTATAEPPCPPCRNGNKSLEDPSKNGAAYGSNSRSDFTSHPNFHLLPSLEDCGYQYKVYSVNLSSTSTTTPRSRFWRRVKRIVGGTPAEFGNHPWMVQIMRRNLTTDYHRPICGGTIINNYTVLTAAHCVTDVTPGSALTHVLLGTYRNQAWSNLKLADMPLPSCNNDETGQQVCSDVHMAKIKDIIVHENYMSGMALHDVALILLLDNIHSFNITIRSYNRNFTARAVQRNIQLIRPICLPRRSGILDGQLYKKFEFVGWGWLNAGLTPTESINLNRMKLTLLPNEECMVDNEFSQELELIEGQLCLMGEPDRGTCFGDSGSPLLKSFPMAELDGKPQIFQVGLDSKSAFYQGGCGLQGVPDFFTNIVEFMPWILDNLRTESED